jgi:hypothetical protein
MAVENRVPSKVANFVPKERQTLEYTRWSKKKIPLLKTMVKMKTNYIHFKPFLPKKRSTTTMFQLQTSHATDETGR